MHGSSNLSVRGLCRARSSRTHVASLQGLKDRRIALDKIRRDTEPLTAPVDGVIADGVPVAGQIAQLNSIIFHIVDPAKLWVEAQSYDAMVGTGGATMRLGNRSLKLAFRGAGLADRNQAIPIHFSIEGGAPASASASSSRCWRRRTTSSRASPCLGRPLSAIAMARMSSSSTCPPSASRSGRYASNHWMAIRFWWPRA